MHQIEQFAMNRAILLAHKAAAFDEVPVGAVVTYQNQIIGEGFNQRETSKQATAHAEVKAIEEACQRLSSWRLQGCSMFVTLEPCVMCAGAIYQARIESVTFGAVDPKGGAMGSLYSVHRDERLNHRVNAQLSQNYPECGHILRDFFQNKRRRKSKPGPNAQ